MSRTIRTEPKPTCRKCGAQMALRRPEEFWCEDWPAFWGCSRFPVCRATVDIGDDGKPIEDKDSVDWDDDINNMPFNAWWYP